MAEGPVEPGPARLRMRGVRKRFGATVALDGVDFAVAPGEVHALVGENGAGKSTLMKILSGAVAPDAGEMQLDGEPFDPRNPLDARRAGVMMIYQELSLAGHLSVEENIMLGMEPGRWGMLDRAEVRRRATDALVQLEHQDIPVDVPVRTLSVAEQQLVEIARAVALGCRVLVLDEPTSSLTQEDAERLFTLITRLKAKGHAIVYISHFLEEVTRISDRYTVLRDGKSVGGGVTAEATVDRIVSLMVGREVTDLYPRSARKRGEPILEVEALRSTAKAGTSSFTLHRGEVLGIAGLVGAGRTEMLRAIFGLDPVRGGIVRVGAYLGPRSPVRCWECGVGLLSEDRKGEGLALGMSVADNITLSKLDDMGPFGLVFPGIQNKVANGWIEKLKIRCQGARQKLTELSGGNQQKVALARMLHHDVDVWLLDEPTRGIDVASKSQIYQLIDDLAAKSDPPKGILVVSSYLPELLGICDRIAAMCRGRLGEARPVKELDRHKLMIEATGSGEAA